MLLELLTYYLLSLKNGLQYNKFRNLSRPAILSICLGCAIFFRELTIFLLISAVVVLQFTSSQNGVLGTKFGQQIIHFDGPKASLSGFWSFFSMKKSRGGIYYRGSVIRRNRIIITSSHTHQKD